MKNFTLSTEVFERYLDASVELFMECYAETITIDSDAAAQEQDSPRLNEKCKALIKATHRRKKLLGFMKGSARLLKSAAVIAVAFLALSSFLFITVDAVREPILKFYIKQNDGNWELSYTPFGADYNDPKHSAPESSFNEKDPLGDLLADDFYLHSVEGHLDGGLSAVYYNDNNNVLSFQCIFSDNTYHINTEDSTVEQIKISGYDTILSEEQPDDNTVLVCYYSDMDRIIILQSDCLSKNELVSIAEKLIFMLNY